MRYWDRSAFVPLIVSEPGRAMNHLRGVFRVALMALAPLGWATSASAQPAELRFVQELRLGRVDGSGPDVFAEVHDLAVDAAGRIYVLDPGWQDVRLFDRDGGFVRQLAPEGNGPGERRHRRQFPTRVTWDEGRGRLWIDDSLFLSVLDSLGVEHARDSRAPDFSRFPDRPATVVVAVDSQGLVYEQQTRFRGDSTHSFVAGGSISPDYAISGDTLRLDSRTMLQDGPRRTRRTTAPRTSGTVTMTRMRPERDHVAWSISPDGTVWLADLDQPRLHELTIAGDTLRTLDVPWKGPSELDISPEGWIWARHAGDDPESTWDVMDNCGVHVGSASVPYAISVTEVGSAGVIHVVASDALDIDYVLRLRLDTEISRRICPR